MTSHSTRWLRREAQELRSWARSLRLQPSLTGDEVLMASELEEVADEADRLSARPHQR